MFHEAGTTDTFTVVLNAQPASDVVLTVTSRDTGEATVTSPLTFTSAQTGSTPQTVTVTGVDDNLVDGTITSAITVAVKDDSSDNNFDPVARPNRFRNHNRQRRSRLHHCSIRWINQRGGNRNHRHLHRRAQRPTSLRCSYLYHFK
ncbi:MAG: hypothetical protein ACJZ2F_02145 [Acidimicrobiales bacterium]